mgnify:FL=1
MKKLLKSKTFWTGIGFVVYGGTQFLQGGNGFESILQGLGFIFVRHGIQKLGEGNGST